MIHQKPVFIDGTRFGPVLPGFARMGCIALSRPKRKFESRWGRQFSQGILRPLSVSRRQNPPEYIKKAGKAEIVVKFPNPVSANR